MEKFKSYLKRIYRLSLSFEKQEKIVWEELKKLHTDAEWKSGFYEKEKFIESFFEGIVFIFIGRFIHYYTNNQFLLFFLIGFTLHMLSEILHIHTFFCNNRCV